MTLLSIHGISLAFGGPPLLNNVSLDIQKGQRICLLGRNGTGKSTLLRIIARETVPDTGEIAASTGIRVAYLPQDVPSDMEGSVFDIVASGAGEAGEKLVALHRLMGMPGHANESMLNELHHYLDKHKGWDVQAIVKPHPWADASGRRYEILDPFGGYAQEGINGQSARLRARPSVT